MSADRPVHQSRKLPAERRISRLVSNPEPIRVEVRPLAALRIDLPGRFGVRSNPESFDQRIRNFTPDGRGTTSLTPLDRRLKKASR